MKTATKVVLGGGALAALLWYLARGKTAGADVGISVTKTSGECDTAAHPNAVGCTATDSVLGGLESDLSDTASAIGGALSSAVSGIAGTGSSVSSYPGDGGFTPSLPPKTTEISPTPPAAGSDGPITPPLQRTVGLGARIDTRANFATSSLVSHHK